MRAASDHAQLSYRIIGGAVCSGGRTTISAVFEAYMEQVLLPTLRPGQAVVLDDLSAHMSERVRELIEGRGCELLFLPPYSPDLNPTGEAFSKVKAFLRKAEARSRGALMDAIDRAPRQSMPNTRGASSSIAATVRQYSRCVDTVMSESRSQ